MAKPSHVLVATDFSPASDVALTYGRALARNFGAQLHLMHVTENVFAPPFIADPDPTTVSDLQQKLDEEAQRELAARLDADTPTLTVAITSNQPALSIVDYARSHGIDLVVLGAHGSSAMTPLLGSVTERVMRTAPCPVLTVRMPEHEFVLPDALAPVGTTSLVRKSKDPC